jgi:hypothetical protein
MPRNRRTSILQVCGASALIVASACDGSLRKEGRDGRFQTSDTAAVVAVATERARLAYGDTITFRLVSYGAEPRGTRVRLAPANRNVVGGGFLVLVVPSGKATILQQEQ